MIRVSSSIIVRALSLDFDDMDGVCFSVREDLGFEILGLGGGELEGSAFGLALDELLADDGAPSVVTGAAAGNAGCCFLCQRWCILCAR